MPETYATDREIVERLKIIPFAPQSAHFEFGHQDGTGTISITEEENGFRVTTLQSPEHYLEGRRANTVYLNSHTPNSFHSIREHYLPGLIRKGYAMHDGRLVLAVGCNGNPSNPDNLTWEDSSLVLENCQMILKIGEKLGRKKTKEITDWFNSFANTSSD